MLDYPASIHKLGAMAKKDKKAMLTVRMDDKVYVELAAAAAQRGLTVSALIHQYAFRVIREEKERDPADFAAKVAEAYKGITQNKAVKKAQKAIRLLKDDSGPTFPDQPELPIKPHPVLMKESDDPRPKTGRRISKALKQDMIDAKEHRRKFVAQRKKKQDE